MTRRVLRVALVAVTLAVAAACGDDSVDDSAVADPAADDSAETVASADADTEIVLDVVDEQLVGGVRREAVGLGDTVAVSVTGDSTDQVHVHGYDRYIDLVDGEGELTFDALIPGIFEIELEGAGRLLVQLEVS